MELVTTGTGKVKVSDAVFAEDFNEGLVHQLVTAYLAGARKGTKAQKTRSEVRGGGAKPYRQKGTGRARAGTIRSPLWRTGGVTFAAKPRSYKQKINRKMFQKGMRVIFSELARQNRLSVAKKIEVDEPKTKKMIEWLKKIKCDNVLIITESLVTNLHLASRNIPNVNVCAYNNIDPVNLVHHNHVIITEDAVRKVEEMFS